MQVHLNHFHAVYSYPTSSLNSSDLGSNAHCFQNGYAPNDYVPLQYNETFVSALHDLGPESSDNVSPDYNYLIPQHDGMYDDDDLLDAGTSNDVRTTYYAFNKEKQAQAIINDSTIDDFETSVNNCNIKCSSGFYSQVAKPCFLSLHSVLNQSDISMTVVDITTTFDKNRYEAFKKYKFSFNSRDETVGGVVVHLHHSTGLIQVQGTAIMPNSNKAPVWFSNFMLSRFKILAKAKKYQIKNSNESFRLSGNPPAEKNQSINGCNHCNSSFSTQSRPSMCATCKHFYHKKFISNHSQNCHKKIQKCSN